MLELKAVWRSDNLSLRLSAPFPFPEPVTIERSYVANTPSSRFARPLRLISISSRTSGDCDDLARRLGPGGQAGRAGRADRGGRASAAGDAREPGASGRDVAAVRSVVPARADQGQASADNPAGDPGPPSPCSGRAAAGTRAAEQPGDRTDGDGAAGGAARRPGCRGQGGERLCAAAGRAAAGTRGRRTAGAVAGH